MIKGISSHKKQSPYTYKEVGYMLVCKCKAILMVHRLTLNKYYVVLREETVYLTADEIYKIKYLQILLR